MLSADNFMHSGTQGLNRYNYVFNNPLKYVDPDGENPLLILSLVLFTTDFGYDVQKAISPVAVKLDISFGSHSNGIGLDVSVGIPQVLPVNYRYDIGVTYYFNRVGGYGSGWQVRNGGEWGIGLPGFQIQYGGIRYRDWNGAGLQADQVVHTAQIGNPFFNLSYSNDTKGSFPWADYVPLIPKLKESEVPGLISGSDRYRTAAARIRAFGLFEVGFFLHTGEADGFERFDDNGNGIIEMTGGNIDDPRRSNGIAYFGFAGLKFGWDAEGIRNYLQNKVAHDFINGGTNGSAYPWILALDRRPGFVFQFGTF
jgi:hypothetical protein